MDIETIRTIKNNPLIYNYLREDSSWYKYLNRDKKYLKNVEEEAKKFYKLTINDRLERLSNNIDLINTFIDVLK